MSNRRSRTFLLDPVDASMPIDPGCQGTKAASTRRRRSSALYAAPSSSASCAVASSSNNNNNLNSGHPSSSRGRCMPRSPSMLLADPIDYIESQMDPCTVDERAWRAQNSRISTSRTGSKYYRRSKAATKQSSASPAMTAPDHTSPRRAHAASPNSSRPSSPSQFIPTSQYHPPRSVSFNLHQNQAQFYDRNDPTSVVSSSSSSSASIASLSSDNCDATLPTTMKENVYSPNNNSATGSTMTGRLTILLANCCFLLGFLKMLHLSDFLVNSTHPLLRAW
mmetsp:Transcript_33698/g.99285  ORF Transcript_33698/g.99285 Transcript_33698/m.99285 type:complete len:279 (-) Transcript_33698:335-1171(-)